MDVWDEALAAIKLHEQTDDVFLHRVDYNYNRGSFVEISAKATVIKNSVSTEKSYILEQDSQQEKFKVRAGCGLFRGRTDKSDEKRKFGTMDVGLIDLDKLKKLSKEEILEKLDQVARLQRNEQ